MLRGIQIRLLPTPEQEQKLWNHVNGFRATYNWGLAEQMRRFEQGEKHLSEYDLRKIFRKHRKTDEQLSACDANALCMAIFDLSNAYKRFFKHHRENPGEKFSKKKLEHFKRIGKSVTNYDLIAHPKFKSAKRANKTFAVQNDTLNFYGGKGVSISGVGKVQYKTQDKLPLGYKQAKFYNPRVSYTNSKWILSFAMDVQGAEYKLNDYGMGIDLGAKVTAVVSCNGKHTVYKNINKNKRIKKLAQKKKRLQRHVARQVVGSKGQKSTYKQIGRIETRIANIRKDFRHKMTTEIVNQLPKVIVIEDLNINGMMKNQHLAKAIGEQGLYTIQNYLTYKSKNRGITIQKANRWYPSSKRCSSCGNIKKDLKLSDRKYLCHNCGMIKCRDCNAADNLEALAMLA